MNQPAERQTASVARLFDALSDSYDTVGVDFFGPIADELVTRLALAPAEDLLDIGCGKGHVLLRAARNVGRQAHVVGIDVSPGMLREARIALDAAGLGWIDLAVADGRRPDLPAGSFDVISSSLVLFFIPDPAAALRSWHDLLRPSGRVGITTFGPQDPVWRSVDGIFQPFLPASMLDARTSGAQGPFGSDEGIEALFRESGFESVRSSHRPVEVSFDDVDHWRAWTMTTGQRAMWQAIPEHRHDEVLGLAASELGRAVGSDGRIRLTQDVRTTLARRPGPGSRR